MILLRAGGAEMHPIPAIRAGVDRVAISPKGSAAVLMAASRRTIYVLQGLPDRVAVNELSIETPDSVSALAISDDGQCVILAAAKDAKGSIWILRTSDGRVSVYPMDTIDDATFFRDSREAAMVSASANRVFIIHDVPGAATVETLAGESDGVVSPSAVATSQDGRRVFVLNRGAKNVLLLPLDGRPAESLAYDCDAGQFNRLSDNDVFLLSGGNCEMPGGLDAGSPHPRLFSITSRGMGSK